VCGISVKIVHVFPALQVSLEFLSDFTIDFVWAYIFTGEPEYLWKNITIFKRSIYLSYCCILLRFRPLEGSSWKVAIGELLVLPNVVVQAWVYLYVVVSLSIIDITCLPNTTVIMWNWSKIFAVHDNLFSSVKILFLFRHNLRTYTFELITLAWLIKMN